MILKHQGQRIRPADPDHRAVDRVHRPQRVLLAVVVDQLDGHLRVRLGIEYVALADQLLAQLLIVFDDAVVNADDILCDMGMRVRLRGLPVRRPARMANAAHAGQRAAAVGLVGQRLQSPLCLDDLRLISVPDGQSRAVIAAVFQPGKAGKQNGRRLMPAHEAHNSAHAPSLLRLSPCSVRRHDSFTLFEIPYHIQFISLYLRHPFYYVLHILSSQTSYSVTLAFSVRIKLPHPLASCGQPLHGVGRIPFFSVPCFGAGGRHAFVIY